MISPNMEMLFQLTRIMRTFYSVDWLLLRFLKKKAPLKNMSMLKSSRPDSNNVHFFVIFRSSSKVSLRRWRRRSQWEKKSWRYRRRRRRWVRRAKTIGLIRGVRFRLDAKEKWEGEKEACKANKEAKPQKEPIKEIPSSKVSMIKLG